MKVKIPEEELMRLAEETIEKALYYREQRLAKHTQASIEELESLYKREMMAKVDAALEKNKEEAE